MKKIFALTFIIFNSIFNSKADTLKVHVIGDFFNGEKYDFVYNGKLYSKKVRRGTDAFAFFIVIPDTIKDQQVINLRVFQKRKLSFNYKDTYVKIYYDSKRKYLILLRDSRIKNRYSFSVFWSNYPFSLGDSLFWKSGYIPDRAKCDSISDTDAFINEPLIW